MDVATGEIHQLTTCAAPCWRQTDVDWSPDESRIAFTEAVSAGCDAAWQFTGTCSIFTINADGTGRHELQTGTVVDPAHPTWSPDGAEIAFSGRVGEEWFVYTMAADTSDNGSEPTRLTAGLPSPVENRPAWSPDGTTIAFLDGEAVRLGLLTADDGSGRVRAPSVG